VRLYLAVRCLAGRRPFHYAHCVSVRWTDETVLRESERWVHVPPDGVRVEDERRLLVHLPRRWGQRARSPLITGEASTLRRAARVLLLDENRRVLLVRFAPADLPARVRRLIEEGPPERTLEVRA
jgi:hypothetical protein